MFKYSKITKVNIYKILVVQWLNLVRQEQNDQALELLEAIWDLKNKTSPDNRFDNAYDNIIQHYFRNDDYETDYMFVEVLKLYEESTDYTKFIEALLDSRYYQEVDYQIGIAAQVESELEKDKLTLVSENYNELGFPQYRVYAAADTDLPFGVEKNQIPFYVKKGGEISPTEKRYFVLIPIKGWNDFHVVSRFELEYRSENGWVQLGRTRIIHKEELITWEQLPDRFLQLGKDFCSLASMDSFYNDLLSQFGNNSLIGILFALQDAAYFTDIHDRYARSYNFKKSLLRSDGAERMLRELRARLTGQDLKDLYSFDYRFSPAYSKSEVSIPLAFDSKDELPSRILAFIGKNGTGKTQLMNSIPQSFAKNSSSDFYGKIPAFSKIISISYSVFDNYKVPRSNATFNYVYCGLKDDEGEMRSSRGLVLSFHKNWKKIEEMERTSKWRSIIRNFIETEIIDGFIKPLEGGGRHDFEVSLDGYNSIKSKLSSGQSILLYIITQVVANIRLDSLILYDEPETHLHPNAIVELMNTIYELVDEFESFCVIATHSPLVVRELFSKNVFVIQRENNMPSVRRIGLESFGENLSVLTDEVFGDREIPKQYKSIIERLIRKGLGFDQIVERLEFDDMPLSLNARIYIQNLIKGR